MNEKDLPKGALLIRTVPRRILKIQPDITALEAANLGVVLSLAAMSYGVPDLWELIEAKNLVRHFPLLSEASP